MVNKVCKDPEGLQGVLTPLKNHKTIGFLSKTVPDPLENHIATKPSLLVNVTVCPFIHVDYNQNHVTNQHIPFSDRSIQQHILSVSWAFPQ